uniref:peptide-methionine (S)-S-oxide reductase n=1 Tax=Timema genevievae TaxID=629358 RepID=A0A7R9JRI2_TIMGE|nr:unnamed protein product [Timema genevievae]
MLPMTGRSRFESLSGVQRNMSQLLHEVDVPIKKATFALGCFWGPDSLFGAMKGVIRTRVGYCGGAKADPTYKSIGDHTEAIDIDYDPNEITYDDLLKVFWSSHDPTSKNTTQYTSIIFYHDDIQKELAEKTLKEEEKKHTIHLVTQILPFKKFYNAEDYHQKYRLQQHSWLVKAVGLNSGPQLTSSHLAARLNGYVVGFGGIKQFESEIDRLGLDEKVADYVRKLVVKYEGRGLTC